jgi:hypothetical protein
MPENDLSPLEGGSLIWRLSVIEAFEAKLKELAGKRKAPRGYLPWDEFIEGLPSYGRNRIEAGCVTSEDELGPFLIMTEILANDCPARYASKAIADAWLHTKLPVLTFNRPEVLPSYIVFTPLDHPSLARNGWAACFVFVKSTPSGLWVTWTCTTIDCSAGAPPIACVDLLLTPEVTESNLRQIVNSRIKDPAGRWLTLWVIKVALGSWYAHVYAPELITEARPSGAGFKRQQSTAARGPMGPTWLGKSLQIPRRSHSGTATGRKLRAHWRAGHYHTVRYGPGKAQRRPVWYLPAYVAGK